MFRPYMWAIFRLRLDSRISYTGMRGAFMGSPGGGGSRSHYNTGYHGPGLSGELPLVVCTHFEKWALQTPNGSPNENPGPWYQLL